MQIIAPEAEPQSAQISAVVILTQHRQSQKFLLLSSFIEKTVAYNYVCTKEQCKNFFLKQRQIHDRLFLSKISKIWSSAASSTLFFAL